MTQLPSEKEMPKSIGAVWILNVIFPGLGNLYASGSTQRGWVPVVVTFVLLFIFHFWAVWPFLYFILSAYGMGEAEAYNRRLRDAVLSEDFRHSRAINSPPGEDRSSRRSYGGGADGSSPHATRDMMRKLREAEIEILKRKEAEEKASTEEVDEQVKQWLKAERQPQPRGKGNATAPDRQLERQSPPPVAAGKAAEPARSAAPQPARSTAPQPARSTTPPVVPGPAAAAQPDSDSFLVPAGLGETGYQPYVLPELSSDFVPSVSAQAGLSSSPIMGTTAGESPLGVGLSGSLLPASGAGAGAAAGADNCKRCGAPCHHDFSFCMQCGHSYAFS